MLDVWGSEARRREWEDREGARLLRRKWEERATGGMRTWFVRLRLCKRGDRDL
ncbi:hypothetical protein P170DRAFT_441171 [Aspergillus steynii IBT 23096]|uniref:Uncharacterized protein n=1 Tax=Aspergillus steynii IBT 23096 TaxID=1392250 RepID=A0A2I2FSW2_9EURO|nr:uncharacterized protein P170DRAFT_441171 [Aspergillus steynii IBT 23096]PLB43712.1 hypothetical protein P170DRAFT_441171 [Aspergillus steynii IBT 23096]